MSALARPKARTPSFPRFLVNEFVIVDISMARSKFDRLETPPPIRVTDRDMDLIQGIYDYAGILTIRHIRQLFFSGLSLRTMERRLSILFHNNYLERPSLAQRRHRPIPEAIYWLGWRGILSVAALQGLEVPEPNGESKNQLKQLELDLKHNGIYWLREPHWVQLRHDIRVIDVRLVFEKAFQTMPNLEVAKWANEHHFRSDYDTVSINGNKKRGVIPDFYFMLVDEGRKATGDPEHKAHLLIEVDMASRDNPRFEREKLQVYANYIGNQAFVERFGSKIGSWLIITTGKRRMKNMLRQADKVEEGKKQHFFFTTYNLLKTANPLTDPIWIRPGMGQPISLIPDNTSSSGEKQLVYKATS